MIMCLAQYELEIFCGLKSGLVEVYDQNILLQNTLEGHKREVLGIDVSKDLLVSISKDMQVFTWSTRTKVKIRSANASVAQYWSFQTCYCSVTMTVLPLSVKIRDTQVFLGLENGQILVFLHLGKGHLVKKKANSSCSWHIRINCTIF